MALSDPQRFESVVGQGVTAQVGDRQVLVGNLALMEANNVALDGLEAESGRLQREAKTAMWVAVDGQAASLIAVADTIKEGSAEAVRRLHDLGLTVVMMTGDNQATAEAIAREAGIERVFAEVKPGDKAAYVRQLQDKDVEDSYELLTTREREILQLIAEGKSNKEIANVLNLSLYTVETHRSNILDKLNLHSVPELILYAVRKGVIG